ncbi:hypothetical protein Tco_0713800, partial [Tanacetum coccineum]
TFYQDKKAEGVGLVLWGDLKVLMDSPKVTDGSDVWKNQHTWSIQSWKLYSFFGVHVLETVSCYNKEWLVQEGTTLGKDFIKSVNGCDDLPKIIRLASPRVNGYLVKASSNPFLFFDSPLPGVNTPWDVMRIVCNPDLMDFMLLRWFFDVASSWNFEASTLLLLVQGFTVSIHWFVLLLLLDVALAAAHSQVSILKLKSEDLSRNLKYVVVKVPAGRYVVPTGKDNVIVSAGRAKVIPAGRTILVMVVLGLL